MPPDPNDKMDDLLKAYAARRREQSGAPFELHPATRNLLQAEVAKLAPRPKERGAKTSFLGRFIFSAAAAVSIAVCAVIMLNNPKHAAPAPATMIAHGGISNDATTSGSVALRLPTSTLSPPVASALPSDAASGAAGLPLPLTPASPDTIRPIPAAATSIRLSNNFTVTNVSGSTAMQSDEYEVALTRETGSADLAYDTTGLRSGGAVKRGMQREEVKKAEIVITYNATKSTSSATVTGTVSAGTGGVVTAASGVSQDKNAAVMGGEVSNSLNGAVISLNNSQNAPNNATIGLNGATGANGTLTQTGTVALDETQTSTFFGGTNLTINNSGGIAPSAPAPAPAAAHQSAKHEATLELKPAAEPAAADQSLASNDAGAAMAKKTPQTRALPEGKDAAMQAEKQKEARMATPGVLTTFQLELVGDNVRLIDADGSTYSGKISQPLLQKQLAVSNGRTFTNLAPGNQFNYADNLKMQQQQDAAKFSQTKIAGTGGGFGMSANGTGGNGNGNQDENALGKQDGTQQQQQLLQNFYFRAVGTNRKLKKVVTFEGNYIAADEQQDQQNKELPAPAAGQGQAKGEGGQKSAPADEKLADKPATPPVDNNARIQGRAQIGDETVDVDAIVVPLKTKAGK